MVLFIEKFFRFGKAVTLRLRETEVQRGQIAVTDGLPALIGAVGAPRDRSGVLQAHPHRRIADAGDPGGDQRFPCDEITVADQPDGFARIPLPQFGSQFGQRQGAILTQPARAVGPARKQGVVDLGAARVHHGAENTGQRGDIFRQGFQRGDAAAGFSPRKRQPLDGCHPDAHARKRSRPARDGKQLDVREGKPRLFEHVLPHRQQNLTVGQSVICRKTSNDFVIFCHGCGRRHGSGIKCQNVHASSSISIMRSPSPAPRRMVTVMASGGMASGRDSLHSHRRYPSRAR